MIAITTSSSMRVKPVGFRMFMEHLLSCGPAQPGITRMELAAGEGPDAEKVGIRLEAEAQKGGLQDVARRDQVWQIMGATRDEQIWTHATNPKILDIIEALLGTEDIKLFTDQTLMKPAFHGSPVSWHQDSGYWTTIHPPALV